MAFAETFKALSDPVRRRILELLKNGRLSAGEIGSHFDMTGATISYHLGILKKAGLVLEFREKNFIYYELNTSVLEEIMLWISELKGGTSDTHFSFPDGDRTSALESHAGHHCHPFWHKQCSKRLEQ